MGVGQRKKALKTIWVPFLSDERTIAIDLNLPEKVTSDEEITIDLSINQKGGTAVIFLVDDGIHAVTGYQNKDLLQHYLGERALGIGFQSNFGQLISQDTSLPTLRVGGDGKPELRRLSTQNVRSFSKHIFKLHHC